MPSIADEFVPLRTRQAIDATAPPEDPSLLQTIGAAGVEANMLFRVWRYNANRENVAVDPNYNPFDDIRGTKYESDPQRFAYSRNREETRAMKLELDQDQEAIKALSRSGWSGTVASLGMGLLDPTIFFPVAKVASGGAAAANALRIGADVAIAGAAGSAISEAAMMTTKPEMTAQDFAQNVGTATLLSGLLGAGGSALLSSVERRALTTKLEQDRIAWGEDIAAPSSQSAGAAASETRNVQLVKTPLDRLPGGDPLGKLSPLRRILNSPFQSARRALVDLAETPYLFEGNAEGMAATNGPALDRMMKLSIRKSRVGLSDTLEGTFTRYRMGQQDANMLQRAMMGIDDIRGSTGGKLTRQEFKSAIDEALRNNDAHQIPEVAEAASYIRNNILNPWRDRAIKAGLLPEDVEPATAASYMMRSWDKEKLTAQRPAAVQRFADWLESEQTRKADVQQKLGEYARQLDEAKGKITELERKAKGGSPEHVAATAEVEKLYGLIEQGLKEWKGKSANEALSAIKARDRAQQGTPDTIRHFIEDGQIKTTSVPGKAARDPGKPRLTSADGALISSLRRILGRDLNLSRDELRGRASEMVDRILGNPDGRLPYDDASPPAAGAPREDARGPLASRDFMIPDEMVREFLDTDVERSLHKFLDTIVPDVLLTERFGDVNMIEAFRKLREEHAALSEGATTEQKRIRLKDQYDAAVADLAAIRDRVRGTYGNTTDPRMRFWGRMASNAMKYSQLTDMGGVIMSSVPDLAGAIFHYGFANAFRHQVAPLLSLLGSSEAKALAKSSKAELRAMGIGVETVLQSRNAAISDVLHMPTPAGRFERALDWASNKFFILNMLSPWTDAGQRIAGTTAMEQFGRAVSASVDGRATRAQLRKLAEAGIDPTMADRIWRQLNTEEGSTVVDGVRLSNTGAWTDYEARDAWEGAIARDVDMMVMSPGQEKSLLPSRNMAAALLLQYKTFVMAATERILFRGMQARDAQTLQGLVALVGLGMVGEFAYCMTTGRDLPQTNGDWVKAGLSRSGALGWIEEGNAVMSKWTGGTTDMYRAVGANNPGSRYQSREKLGVLLGPTANKIEGILRAGSDALNRTWGPADTRRLRRLVAGQNLFYVRRMFDQIGEE